MANKVSSWFLNPFERIAGWQALWIGLVVMAVMAATGVTADIRFDGVIDMHLVENATWREVLLDLLVGWGTLSVILFGLAVLSSKSTVRFIDIAGTQALARIPFLVMALIAIPLDHNKVVDYISWHFLGQGEEVTLSGFDVAFFVVFVVVSLLLLIYAIYIMYKAYSTSANVTGAKGVLSFTGGLVLAEIISKILIFWL